MRLAVGLGFAPDDPMRAAMLGGVLLPGDDGQPRPPTDDELAELIDQMGPHHHALREGHERALAQLLIRFEMLNAISLLEQEPLLQPKERSFAGRMTQQIVKDLGGQRAVFGAINVSLGKKKGT